MTTMGFYFNYYWPEVVATLLLLVIVFYNLYSFRKKFRIFRVLWHGKQYLDMEDEILIVLALNGKCTFNELVTKNQDFIDDQKLFKTVLLALVKTKEVNQVFPEYKLNLDVKQQIVYEIPYYSVADDDKQGG